MLNQAEYLWRGFSDAFGLSTGLAHTFEAIAGANEFFVDERRLRSVSEAFQLNRSPADPSSSNLLD
jgi:hypothetical protein